MPSGRPQGATDSGAARDRPDVFLSYAREDKDFVEQLTRALGAREKDVWIDVEDIRGGASDWRATIWGGIESATAMMFVLTPDSLASTVCGEELQHAVELNKRIIPVLRRSVDGLPYRSHSSAELGLRASGGRLRRQRHLADRCPRARRGVGRAARKAYAAHRRVAPSRPGRQLPAARHRSPRRRALARRPGCAQRGTDDATGHVHHRQPARGGAAPAVTPRRRRARAPDYGRARRRRGAAALESD